MNGDFHIMQPVSVDRLPKCHAGSQLKLLLAGWPFYMQTTPSCACEARASMMNRLGCEWCEENVEQIVGWLREEADRRGLPFLDAAGRMLVKRAIRNARRVDRSTDSPTIVDG